MKVLFFPIINKWLQAKYSSSVDITTRRTQLIVYISRRNWQWWIKDANCLLIRNILVVSYVSLVTFCNNFPWTKSRILLYIHVWNVVRHKSRYRKCKVRIRKLTKVKVSKLVKYVAKKRAVFLPWKKKKTVGKTMIHLFKMRVGPKHLIDQLRDWLAQEFRVKLRLPYNPLYLRWWQ